MTLYSTLLDVSGESTTATKVFAAGPYILTVTFTWDETNEEQYQLIARALKARADADPLVIKEGEWEREYDWIEYYLGLPADLETYLAEGGKYPQSLYKMSDDEKIFQLRERIEEAEGIQLVKKVYDEQRVWNVFITDSNGNEVQGAVRPGGWIHNQDAEWRVRFVSLMKEIGRYDISKVYMEAEVAE